MRSGFFISAAAPTLVQLGFAYPSLAFPELEARADPNPWQPVPAGGSKSLQHYFMAQWLNADSRGQYERHVPAQIPWQTT